MTDFSPLREVRKCKDEILKKVDDSVSVHEVDAHNVVPAWVASDKLEYSARTIRNKINNKLPEYLIEFPTIAPPLRKWGLADHVIEWDEIIADVLRLGLDLGLFWIT